MDLTSFRTLGRSGLVVSPFALGTMTFGASRWGVEEEAAHQILDAYVDAGGNFIDTADVYGAGRSEEMVGSFVANRSLRDQIVIGTKFTFNLDDGNPNAGGNGRKNVVRALEASLRRLGTDYVDVYWSHFWDMTTPADEVLETFVDLVRSGKIRYYALSNAPAWYVAKITVLAAERGVPGPLAFQGEYSLVERTAENEHVPLARECGLGLVPWSPLAGGFLTGKYSREDPRQGSARLDGPNPLGATKFTDRNWEILAALRQVAEDVGCPPARTALAWTLGRPTVSTLLLGVSRPEQVGDNVAALGLELTRDQRAILDAVSAPAPAFPYSAFTAETRGALYGGTQVRS